MFQGVDLCAASSSKDLTASVKTVSINVQRTKTVPVTADAVITAVIMTVKLVRPNTKKVTFELVPEITLKNWHCFPLIAKNDVKLLKDFQNVCQNRANFQII